MAEQILPINSEAITPHSRPLPQIFSPTALAKPEETWDSIDEGWDLEENVGGTIRKAILEAVEKEASLQKMSPPLPTEFIVSAVRLNSNLKAVDNDKAELLHYTQDVITAKMVLPPGIKGNLKPIEAKTSTAILNKPKRSRTRVKKKLHGDEVDTSSEQLKKKTKKKRISPQRSSGSAPAKKKKQKPAWLLPVIVFLTAAIVAILAIVAAQSKS